MPNSQLDFVHKSSLGYNESYLVAVMDWFSHYVLSWQLSNSIERRLKCMAEGGW